MIKIMLMLALVGCAEHGETPPMEPTPACIDLGCSMIDQTNRACPATGDCVCDTTPCLPSCAWLGCPSPELADKICAIRGECYCQLARDQPRIRCAP